MLTNLAMYHAAQRRLAAHIATRHATPAEQAEIVANLRASEVVIRKGCDELRNRVPTCESADFALALRDWAGKTALHLEPEADKLALQAEAWESVGAAEAWESTRTELADRVRYYGNLVHTTGDHHV